MLTKCGVRDTLNILLVESILVQIFIENNLTLPPLKCSWPLTQQSMFMNVSYKESLVNISWKLLVLSNTCTLPTFLVCTWTCIWIEPWSKAHHHHCSPTCIRLWCEQAINYFVLSSWDVEVNFYSTYPTQFNSFER